MSMKDICIDLINLAIEEFKKEENVDKVRINILDPCLNYFVSQFYPYIIATCIIFILTFILAISILILLLNGGSSTKHSLIKIV
jgi:hypothetical protein